MGAPRKHSDEPPVSAQRTSTPPCKSWFTWRCLRGLPQLHQQVWWALIALCTCLHTTYHHSSHVCACPASLSLPLDSQLWGQRLCPLGLHSPGAPPTHTHIEWMAEDLIIREGFTKEDRDVPRGGEGLEPGLNCTGSGLRVGGRWVGPPFNSSLSHPTLQTDTECVCVSFKYTHTLPCPPPTRMTPELSWSFQSTGFSIFQRLVATSQISGLVSEEQCKKFYKRKPWNSQSLKDGWVEQQFQWMSKEWKQKLSTRAGTRSVLSEGEGHQAQRASLCQTLR